MLEQNPSLVIEIYLRYLDGNPVVGEPVWMEHLGNETYSTPDVFTDRAGSCLWWVYPGLHELCVPKQSILGSLPILALRGSGLAIPGMVAGAEKTTYHLVLDEDHLAFDATPLAPLPTPVRCWKRQTYEMMVPAPEPVPSRLVQVSGGAEGVASIPASRGENPIRPVVHNPFMRLSTVWVLQPRPRLTDAAELGAQRAHQPTFFYKSLGR